MRRAISTFADRTAFLAVVGLLLAGGWGTASAQVVNLQWNANGELDLAGYRVYYDTDPNTFNLAPVDAALVAGTIDVGKTTTTQSVNGLSTGVTWYFGVTALDLSGNESGFSNIESATPSITPTVRSVSPSVLEQGDSNRNVTITGDNFSVGSTVDLGPDVTVNSVDDSGAPGTLVANVSVALLARANSRSVTVTNPGGAMASKANAFRVEVDVSRVDVDNSGRIDNADFLEFLVSYPSSSGSGTYTTDHDFDVDGMVDGADLAIFFTYFGLNAPFP